MTRTTTYNHGRTHTGQLLRSPGHLPGPESFAHQEILENHYEAQSCGTDDLLGCRCNPDTLNHGKLERFLDYFDADIIILQGTRLRMRTAPRDGKARDDTTTPVKSGWGSKGYKVISRGWSTGENSNHACGVLIATREAPFGAGQIAQRYDPPRALAGRLGGIRVKNRQSHSDLTEYAPQENGPPVHKEYFWDHVTKTVAKPPRRTSVISGGDFNKTPFQTTQELDHVPLRDSNEQWSARGGHLCCCAALKSGPVVCEADPIVPELERQHVDGAKRIATQTRSHFTFS